MTDLSKEPMLDLFVFETMQLIDQLEQSLLACERGDGLESSIGEIFRIIHTIKGSAAMMLFNNISDLAHAVEDLFAFLRESKPERLDRAKLTDTVLAAVDFIKNEVAAIADGKEPSGDATPLVESVEAFLSELKEANSEISGKVYRQTLGIDPGQKYYIGYARNAASNLKKRYSAVVYFEEDCGMENIRAFSLVHNLKEIADAIEHVPENIIDNDECIQVIRDEGFRIVFRSERCLDEVRAFLLNTPFLKDLRLEEEDQDLADGQDADGKPKKQILLDEPRKEPVPKRETGEQDKDNALANVNAGMISVNVAKLDKLMDLVGELVIAEAMVTGNPELEGLPLDSFYKASRQLHKLTSELQDIVMSIRMVPLAATFQKMNRLVRDMSRKLHKDVQLEIIGEETEVDKNIIEHLSDPLMHLIRNAMDHGLETAEERLRKGKPTTGKIVLEAKSAGGDVWIIVRDDGRGLNREKILQKAREKGLFPKTENELTDREIYAFILLPGFSTKDKVTEFSGRGVGMDVVVRNIEKIGGTVLIDSAPDAGAVFSLKIPLTLAIIDGMTVKVGNSRYTLPTISIKESFRPKENEIITDPDGNEMIMIRGECYPVLRLHRIFHVKTEVTRLHEGIIIMAESEGKNICLFADALLGEQQVVVKGLPSYIKKVRGIAGCTLLGDGGISLILDTAGLAAL